MDRKHLLAAGMAMAMAATLAQAGEIDHVILAVPELDKGGAELAARTGIVTEFGGVHISGDTANRLASLGGKTYLEVLGPAPGKAPSGDGAGLAKLDGPVPDTFAVRVTDADAAAARFKAAGLKVSEVIAGGRTTPRGQTLHWKTFGVEAGEFCSLVPFFIEWSADTAHPSSTAPQGAKLEAIRISHPRAAELTRLYGVLGVPLKVAQGPARMELVLTGARGTATYGGAPTCEP